MTFIIRELFTEEQLELDINLNSSFARMKNIMDNCFNSCISYGKLTQGELLCTDRCVKKFIQVAEIAHKRSSERAEAERAEEEQARLTQQ